MNNKMTAVRAALCTMAVSMTVSTKVHASVGSVEELATLIMQEDAYFYGAVGACVLVLLMIVAGVAGMGRRQRRQTIAAYDDELTRYRQQLRRAS